MDPKANPIRKRGERNIYCPFYSDCLDYVVKHFWQYWSCSQCPHKLMQSIPECEYEVNDGDLYYEISTDIFRGFGKMKRTKR